MSLRTAEGWRHLALVSLVLGAPVAGALLIYALIDIQGFMRSPSALWVMLACVFVPYSISYVADLLRKRESRRGPAHGDGDGSALRIEGPARATELADRPLNPGSRPTVRRAAVGIWVGLSLVVAYAAFRLWALLRDGSIDWTLIVVGCFLLVVAALMPSYLGWRRFQVALSRIPDVLDAWPVFRTDQFADELHRFRPASEVPQDLCLVFSTEEISVWTCGRSPRPLLVLPRDATSTVSAASITDRLGSQAIRIRRIDAGRTLTFDLIVRPKGMLTYFRAPEGLAARLAKVCGKAGQATPGQRAASL